MATYIPDRYDEGYGISFKGIDFADDNGFSLIIALDCGIKSIDHVEYANERKIDFIICDHHRPGDNLPKAIAVLDPFVQHQSFVTSTIVGATSLEQLKENIDSHNIVLSEAILKEINVIQELIPNPAP